MIKQFVPQDFCLSCKNCCRFKDADSVWSPCLLDEEVVELIDQPKIPAASISAERRLQLVPGVGGEGFLCPFLSPNDNRCQIYQMRPFECQLYPFLLNLRNKKVYLTVDLNCPYVKDKLNSEAFKEYIDYLLPYLNSKDFLNTLKDNPHILQAYEDVLNIMEIEGGK